MTIKRINLALQGGGAHGAFTWGVLDRLLEEEDLEIAAITGTSAGALNGAALKAGLVADGSGYDRQGAKDMLDWLWGKVAGVSDMRLTHWMSQFFAPTDMISKAMEMSPMMAIADATSRMISPYHYGPFYQNPLKQVVDKLSFDQVCSKTGPSLFISATNVRTGKIRVFSGDEISTDVILASACLPTVFQAVEFEDPKTGEIEAFWDGGYTGNPALFPLFGKGLPDDVVVVNINPLLRDEVPREPTDILNRINEISFNSSLLRELRAINFVKRLISDGRMEGDKMRDVLVHMISDDEMMRDLNVATKLSPSPVLLARMKAAGRNSADVFLAEHKHKIGKCGSVDLKEMFS